MRRLLTLGQPHRNTAIRAHLQSRKSLALLVVLVLCLSVFILADNEAWAKEQPSSPAAQQGPAEGKNTPNGQANGKVAEPVSGTPTPPVTPPVQTPSVEKPPVENAPPPPASETPPPVERPSSPPLEPAPSTPKPDPAPQPAPQVGAGGEEEIESDPVPHTSRPSTTDSNQVVEPKLVSTASPDVADEVVDEDVHLAPARGPGPATPAAEVFRTLAGGSAGTPSSDATSGTQQAPSDDTSKQPAPLASQPLGDGLFSPFTGTTGGQSGAGGGAAPLLVGILVLLTVSLARRDFRTYLIACEVPKPSSALLRPLERPG